MLQDEKKDIKNIWTTDLKTVVKSLIQSEEYKALKEKYKNIDYSFNTGEFWDLFIL